ncbi:MAG: copper chaperone PCu(A)C [Alcanivoracaceae bacterium]|nr:copper chaperone PCu(A)C [Alcanivoracaceae bacterium]
MKKLSFILLTCLVSTAIMAGENFPKIENHWLRAAPPNAMMQAAYGELTNYSNEDKILIGAYSPDYNMIEIHKTTITDGVASMIHQPQLTIKPNDKLIFEPGGLHIMLMHPTKSIKAGEKIKICLIYQQGDKETVQHILFPVIRK